MRPIGFLLLACALISCQAVSGLSRLRFVESDAGEMATERDCDGAASCDDTSTVVGSIACEPDAGSCPCASSSAADGCEVVSQCGCESGQHCQLRDGAPTCVEPGAQTLGGPCQNDSECSRGGACIEGLCARYCERDADCESGRCHATALRTASGESVRACQRRCDFTTQAPCEQGAQCARFSPADESAGDYCVAPSSSCVSDGRCDEPDWGTRRCVAGSDTADCACAPRIAGASCGLISQCGCAPSSHCALIDVQGTTAQLGCVADRAPLRKPGEACNAETECPGGYSCWRGLCEKYCTSAAECDGGQCVAVRNPDELNGLSLCSVACDFDANSGCLSGTQCARAPDGQSYCLVPRAPCPFQNDGVCDEPQGTRVCVEGSDSGDCS